MEKILGVEELALVRSKQHGEFVDLCLLLLGNSEHPNVGPIHLSVELMVIRVSQYLFQIFSISASIQQLVLT